MFNYQFCNFQSIFNVSIYQRFEALKIGGLNENWKLEIENWRQA